MTQHNHRANLRLHSIQDFDDASYKEAEELTLIKFTGCCADQLANCDRLKWLRIEQSDLTDEMLGAILNIPSLAELQLVAVRPQFRRSRGWESGCTRLDKLFVSCEELGPSSVNSIICCTKPSKIALSAVKCMQPYKRTLLHLRDVTDLSIDFTRTSQPDIGVIREIVAALPELRRLSFFNFTTATDDYISELGDLRTIEEVRIDGSPLVVGNGFRALDGIPALWSLSVGRMPAMSVDGCIQLAHLPSIHHLMLYGLPGVTDDVLNVLSIHPKVESLIIFGCDNITRSGVRRLLLNGTIESLQVLVCKGVDDSMEKELKAYRSDCVVRVRGGPR